MKETNVTIGLSDPKTPENVGSVLRAAGNYRASKVMYSGQRYDRAVKRNTVVTNVGRKVGENVSLSAVDCLIENAPKDAEIICIEFAVNAIALPAFKHPHNAYYIFGPEDGSISQDIIDKADAVVYVPTVGSMNLAATVNVVLYDRLAKMPQDFDDNDLIKRNRDKNNNLKVRIDKN